MSSETIESLLAGYAPEVQSLALKARALVRSLLPDTIEQIDMPARLIGYGYDRTYTGTICGIALQKSYVNLMFSRGTELPDPQGLLEGTGKKARHVKIRSAEDVDRPAVRALIEAAAQATRAAMEKKQRKG
jgi:hypothetical protein